MRDGRAVRCGVVSGNRRTQMSLMLQAVATTVRHSIHGYAPSLWCARRCRQLALLRPGVKIDEGQHTRVTWPLLGGLVPQGNTGPNTPIVTQREASVSFNFAHIAIRDQLGDANMQMTATCKLLRVF